MTAYRYYCPWCEVVNWFVTHILKTEGPRRMCTVCGYDEAER